MCTHFIQDFSFQFSNFYEGALAPVRAYCLTKPRVKISETLHVHGVHFEEHMKTIGIPTLIPLLKIKVG